jgi:hypothetical protein
MIYNHPIKKEIGALRYLVIYIGVLMWRVREAFVVAVELDAFTPSSSIIRLKDIHFQRLGYTGLR